MAKRSRDISEIYELHQHTFRENVHATVDNNFLDGAMSGFMQEVDDVIHKITNHLWSALRPDISGMYLLSNELGPFEDTLPGKWLRMYRQDLLREMESYCNREGWFFESDLVTSIGDALCRVLTFHFWRFSSMEEDFHNIRDFFRREIFAYKCVARNKSNPAPFFTNPLLENIVYEVECKLIPAIKRVQEKMVEFYCMHHHIEQQQCLDWIRQCHPNLTAAVMEELDEILQLAETLEMGNCTDRVDAYYDH